MFIVRRYRDMLRVNEFDSLDTLMKKLNKILIKMDNLKSYPGDDKTFNISTQLIWRSGNSVVGVGGLDDIEKLRVYLPYILFPEGKHIDYKMVCNFDKDPDTLLDLMTVKCLTDPYILITHLFGDSQNIIFRSYIGYLNKTLSSSKIIQRVDITTIQMNFFINGEPANLVEFNKLFMFYLIKKGFTPFHYTFQTYKSKFM